MHMYRYYSHDVLMLNAAEFSVQRCPLFNSYVSFEAVETALQSTTYKQVVHHCRPASYPVQLHGLREFRSPAPSDVAKVLRVC